MSDIADRFVLKAIQEWGQPTAERIAAVQAVLTAAKFSATATCYPVFGGIWPKPCDGPDGEAATQWLRHLTNSMPRGRFENETAHVAAEIAARAA